MDIAAEHDPPVTLLLVEDSPGDLRLIREALEEEGGRFEVRHAERLSEAVEALEKGGVGVVLSDLGLPDSQGLDTLRGLRAAAPEVPVILLTASEDRALVEEASRLGAQDYLVKGLYPRGLLGRTLRYALSRHAMERQIREQSALYALQLEGLSDLGEGAAIVEGGRIVVANAAYARLAGYSVAALLALPATACPLPSSVRPTLQGAGDVGRPVPPGESTLLRADGRHAEVEFALKRLPPAPRPRWFLLVRDIAARKHATEALRQSEERWRDVVESMQDGYFEIDVQGVVVAHNASLARILGRGRDSLFGASLKQFVDESSLPGVYAAVGRLVKDGVPVTHMEVRVRTPGHGPRLLSLSATRVLDVGGHATGVRGIVRDITSGTVDSRGQP